MTNTQPPAAESDLHAAIMRLPCDIDDCTTKDWVLAFKEGHKIARHAAAELAARPSVVSEGQAVAWRLQYDDFQHFSGATVAGQDKLLPVKPDMTSKFWDGLTKFTLTPLYTSPAAPAPAAPTAAQAPEVAAGVELAARYIEKKRDAYHHEHGSQESDTGAWNYPGDGQDWVNDMDELVEEIRALATQPKAAPVAEAPTDLTTMKCPSCDGKGGYATASWVDPVSGPECEGQVCEECEGQGRIIVEASVAAPATEQAKAEQPALTVWYGSMTESNGKSNFTAILTRRDATGLDVFDGFTIARSEYPDRVRYEADCVRHLIGELPEKPWITDYDADKHSGYVAAQASPAKPDLSGLRRYHLESTEGSDHLIERPDGWWVNYDDVAALLAAITKENDK